MAQGKQCYAWQSEIDGENDIASAPELQLIDEIIDFLAASPSTQEISAYQPLVVLQQQLHELLERNRDKRLTEGELAELEDFYRLDRFMSRLKLRARDLITEK